MCVCVCVCTCVCVCVCVTIFASATSFRLSYHPGSCDSCSHHLSPHGTYSYYPTTPAFFPLGRANDTAATHRGALPELHPVDELASHNCLSDSLGLSACMSASLSVYLCVCVTM